MTPSPAPSTQPRSSTKALSPLSAWSARELRRRRIIALYRRVGATRAMVASHGPRRRAKG